MSIEIINVDLCIGCGICAQICPMDVIRMDTEKNKAIIRYPEDCMVCEFCIHDCPTDAITLIADSPIQCWG
jgi:NAD-dependent dihydropyrimidine dehydrogenase PreA subunit